MELINYLNQPFSKISFRNLLIVCFLFLIILFLLITDIRAKEKNEVNFNLQFGGEMVDIQIEDKSSKFFIPCLYKEIEIDNFYAALTYKKHKFSFENSTVNFSEINSEVGYLTSKNFPLYFSLLYKKIKLQIEENRKKDESLGLGLYYDPQLNNKTSLSLGFSFYPHLEPSLEINVEIHYMFNPKNGIILIYTNPNLYGLRLKIVPY